MNGASHPFLVPREQFLAWKYLCLAKRRGAYPGPRLEAKQHFFFWARNALYHALGMLDVPRAARVLLPAYLCRAAVEPFVAYGLQCDFYETRRDCTPDLDEIEAKLHPDTRIVMTVHYFGFPQRIREFRALCSRKNLLLFEDCAHVLQNETQKDALGSLGDASIFSYRKFLPMFDGAALLFPGSLARRSLNNRMERSQFAFAAMKFLAGQAINSSSGLGNKVLLEGIAFAKTITRGKKRAQEGKLRHERIDANSVSFDLTLVNQPITAPSSWILGHSNVPAIIDRRRENYRFLHQIFSNTPGITPLHAALPNEVCPLVYPLFIDDIADAHLLLRNAGIPAVSWGGVRPAGVSQREFPEANFLYENLVFLPIHQNLCNRQLKAVAEAVKTVRSRTRRAPSVFAVN